MELMHASRQWSSRPADERFTSLTDLLAVTKSAAERSVSTVKSSRGIEFRADPKDELKGIQIVSKDSGRVANPTNFSFGQIASLAGVVPGRYLRNLPAPLAADCLNYGLNFHRNAEDIGLLMTKSEPEGKLLDEKGNPIVELRAATGPNYGRVWNHRIVSALCDRFGDGATGQWKVPGEFGKDVPITKDNTTIYGSDRDMFVFLADEKNRVEIGNRRNGQSGSLARGFFVWNSEVGAQSIGAAFFLFDYACSNRIVWGAQEFKELRLRHTASAPHRWLEEITPVLMDYANAAAAPVEQTIKLAQQKRIDTDLEKFLTNRKFTAAQATAVKAAHEREEGRPIETAWDMVTGITAYAKTIRNQDDRVEIERRAGKLLDAF